MGRGPYEDAGPPRHARRGAVGADRSAEETAGGPDSGANIEDIADAPRHVNPNVTRAVYRHQISDTVTRAPAALDQALAAEGKHDPLAPS